MAKRALLSLLLVASQCLIDIVAFTPLLIPRGHHGSTASSTETAFQRLRSNPSARHGLVSVEMLAARPKIAFVQTGGTIDKDYPRSTLGYAFEIADPAVERIIADASHVPLGIDLDFHTICRKDSTEITSEDRRKIADLCSTIPNHNIIITHGTDTMIETANYLADDDRLRSKTVVLTGAMRPQRFRESDAPFNVGGAVGAVQVLPAGVFVVMGGAVFPHDQCRRNLESGAFEGLSPFAVGDKVLVEEPIESDFEDSLDLPQGTVGNVLSIDAEGDAYIDFGGSIGKQWVSSRQFGKLWSPNEDEDAPPSSGADVPLFPS